VTAVFRSVRHEEGDLAAVVATHLGIPLTLVESGQGLLMDRLASEVPLPAPLDEPSLSDWRRLIGAAARASHVVLWGEGGDALHQTEAPSHVWKTMGLGAVGATLRYVIAHRRLPYLGMRLRERLGLVPRRRQPSIPPFMTDAARARLAALPPPDVLGRRGESPFAGVGIPMGHARLSTAVPLYMAPLLSPEITRERAELRCPFLDSRLLAFMATVPHIPWCQRKELPRRAYRRALPAEILRRPKTGVVGLHEQQVAAWQQHAAWKVDTQEITAWTDRRRLEEVLLGTDAFAVADAWRALQLEGWLVRRHEVLAARAPGLCTA
jgi:hypothetical protein